MATSAQLDRLQKRHEAVVKAVRDALQPALLASGQELTDAMKVLAETSRKTGALIDSIVLTEAGNTTPAYSQPGGLQYVPNNTVVITAGNTAVRYAHFVEYGTSRSVAEPFFWPAYRLLKDHIAAKIKLSVSNAVWEGWRK